MDEDNDDAKAVRRSLGWAAMLVGPILAIVIVAIGFSQVDLGIGGPNRDADGPCERFAIVPDHERPCAPQSSAWPTALLVIGGGVGLAGIVAGLVLIASNPRRHAS